MSALCRSSSSRGWIRSCGGCSGIPTTIQLTAAVVQTWIRLQLTPTGMSVLLKLYKSLMVRPHFRYCVSSWSPHYAKGKSLLERVQYRLTRTIPGLTRMPCEKRLEHQATVCIRRRDCLEFYLSYWKFIWRLCFEWQNVSVGLFYYTRVYADCAVDGVDEQLTYNVTFVNAE